MDNRSLARELSLISLGLISDSLDENKDQLQNIEFDDILESAIELITNHCKQELNECETVLESASNNLLNSELFETDRFRFSEIREEIKQVFLNLEKVMNTLSETLEFPQLIAISDQSKVRNDIKDRISKVVVNLFLIDSNIDNVMHDWRFKRLPRIDRDILRLAYVDINYLNTPIPVACNEAVNLANKYSDIQGRKMINGVLRRMQKEN